MTSAARNTSAISSTRWRGSVVRKYDSQAGPNSPIAASTYSGVDGWTWKSIARGTPAASVARGFGGQLGPEDRAVRPIAAVAGLGERVGAEAEELLGRQQLVDRGRDLGVGVREIEVVDDLATLVAEVALVLEASRTAHEPENLPVGALGA